MVDEKEILTTAEDDFGFFESLGLSIEPDDIAYFFLIFPDAISEPRKLKEKIPVLTRLIDKVIPDEKLTQERVSRMLFAVEKISFALRKIIEIKEFNVIGELKDISKQFLEMYPDNKESATSNTKTRIDELIIKISQHESADVQMAWDILSNIDILLNIEEENRNFVPLIQYSPKKELKETIE
jgi:hypothetical protein